MAPELTNGQHWSVFAAFVFAFSVAGCSAVPQMPKDIDIGADIIVSGSLNPDLNGRASPLILAIYQLKSADKFRNGDFFSVFDPEGTALGDDLLRREQITLQPGGSRSFEAEFSADTVYIGLVGAFSDLENSQWRAVIEIPEKNLLTRVLVDFNGNRRTVVIRYVERSAIGHDSPSGRDTHLTNSQEVRIEPQLGKSPGIRTQVSASQLDKTLDVSRFLLEVVRLQEQPLGPDYFATPRHLSLLRQFPWY